jgi:asparaginyl-tRNA synthetase
MDTWTPIKKILKGDLSDKEVKIRGWIHRTRSSGKIVFALIRDSTGIIQVTIIKGTASDSDFDDAQRALVESSVIVAGTVREDNRAPSGYEIQAKSFDVVGFAEPFPITKDQSPEFLLDNRHLWLRSRHLTSALKIRHTVVGAIHEFFRSRGYYEFNPPILTPTAAEGTMTLFEVKYFDDLMYLSQSWQLYAEAGIFALEKIYDVAPTFRSEPSKTPMHTAEFWMCEMEAAWMKLDELGQVAKDEVRFIIKKVLEENQEELELLERDTEILEKYAAEKYPTITYTEVLDILRDEHDIDIPWGKDLRTIEEAKIGDHFEVPVVVTHYPKDIMAFYKPPDPKDPKTALCLDMIAPEGYREIIGGSERSTDIEQMRQDLHKKEAGTGDYEWYFDLRRFGSVPHSGYGLGLERVVAWVCGLDNIKDAIPFPRTMTRIRP